MGKKETESKEIFYHHKFLTWLDEANIKYDTWGASGPDVIFYDYDPLGEFKVKESKTSYKLAFKEIQKRTKREFNIRNRKYFFVLTEKFIRFFSTETIEWDHPDFGNYIDQFDYEANTLALFNNNESDKESFIEYIKNNCSKISVDANISKVLDLLLSNELNITLMDAIIILLNLNKTPVYLKNSIVYNAGQDSEYIIKLKDKKSVNDIKIRLIDKYYIKDINAVKNYIKYNYSSHLSDNKKSNLGKYYTPQKIVEIMHDWVSPLLTDNSYVLDLACGCGAFVEIFNDTHIIGRDIDENAVEVLKVLGIPNIEKDNSLVNVTRAKYGLKDDDHIIIIGNPPYNDTSSKNKRFGTNAKSATGIEIDKDIYSKDLGQSFMKAFAKLNPEYICILHPLSYLIKNSNFNSLKQFTEKYKLIKGTIFPSSLFPDLRKSTEFPILIGLYAKGTMDYDYITKFEFNILNSDKKFKLSNFETIDKPYKDSKNYIRKYPTKVDKDHILKSDIDLYQYNIRDTNSLMASGNLMYLATNDNVNYCTVNFADLYKYCYLNMYKFFAKNNYLIGNLSPLINIDEYEKDFHLQDMMIIGSILKNRHRIKIFDIADHNSIIYKKFLINDYRKKSKTLATPNIYSAFLDIVDGKNVEANEKFIYDNIAKYFDNLIKKYI